MKHMHIEKKIKNHEEKGKSFISFLLNSAHNGTRNIRGPAKARRIDQGFEQQRAVAVQSLPVLGKLMRRE